MAHYSLIGATIGPKSERPDAGNPSGATQFPPSALYLCLDTGEVYQSGGSGWTLIGTLAIAGGLAGANAITGDGSGDALSIAGTAGAHHFLLIDAGALAVDASGNTSLTGSLTATGGAAITGPGGSTPSLTAIAKSGQTGYIGEFIGTDGVTVKASIAVDGEFLTVDDVLAPTGQVKGATVGFYPTGTSGAPASGAHNAGEMIMDSAGAIFACVTSGSPGTWKTVTLT